jgi:hypothetical protein
VTNRSRTGPVTSRSATRMPMASRVFGLLSIMSLSPEYVLI